MLIEITLLEISKLQVTVLVGVLSILALIGVSIFLIKRRVRYHLDPPFQPPARELFVANMGDHSILGFSIAFDVETTPKRIIIGPNTGLHNPVDVALDVNKNIWVVNLGDPPNVNPSITVYAPYANGDATPIATHPAGGFNLVPDFAGAIATRFQTDLFAGRQPRDIYTAQCISGGLFEFSLSSSVINFEASIQGAQTQIRNPTGIAVNSNGDLFVAISSAPMIPGLYTVANPTNAILRFNNPSEGHNLSGPPDGVISGLATVTGLNNPAHICCDMANQLYVANRGGLDAAAPNPSISIYAAGAVGGAAPIRNIISDGTWGNIYGIAVDEAGLIFVSGANSIYVFAATANGAVAPIIRIPPLNSSLPSVLTMPMGLAVGSQFLPPH
jgi:hypothetical protein